MNKNNQINQFQKNPANTEQMNAMPPKNENNTLQTSPHALNTKHERVELVVFDLDGTCLDGSSTVRLVLDLLKHGKLFLHTGLIIGFWGLAYKLKLPQNEAWVRSKVWKAFVGKPKVDVDKFLCDYVDRVVEKIWRDQASAEIEKHHGSGRQVVIVSASFEPIVSRVCEIHGIDHQISTRMRANTDGLYEREVDGMPIEGMQKVLALRAYADGYFGKDNWIVTHAYADHYSDIPILELSQTPHAICPDRALLSHAQHNKWDVISWDEAYNGEK